MNIIWVSPTLFKNLYPRLGGMHLFMSFVGAVGALMSNTGLENILSSKFAGVPKILNGKKFPQTVHALRL